MLLNVRKLTDTTRHCSLSPYRFLRCYETALLHLEGVGGADLLVRRRTGPLSGVAAEYFVFGFMDSRI